MVPFAGYEMPVQYELGVMKEHLHTRARAGLFDVSHMGQLRISGTGVGAALERLMPVDVLGLGVGRQRYGMFTSPQGGVLDDLMFANRGDHVFMVVNAACKADDLAHLEREIGTEVSIEMLEDRALLALQGPEAETALASLNPAAAEMRFMDIVTMDLNGADCWVSRSGYTGEDGYEVSVPVAAAEGLARALLDHAAVAPIGLGARDSLRLEAGLCLYGHDMDADTTPVEAGLSWAIGKARRPGGDRAGGFAGADRILTDLAQGPKRKRVGLLPEGRAPMREGVELFETETSAEPLGRITSGGFGPTIDGPVAMGYLPPDHTNPGTQVFGELRGKRLPLTVAPLPFTPANFKR
jgi:aminomethyltransferase